jgi:hypothetical protein
MEFRPRMTRLWAEWAATPEIFQRYSRLFTALGMEPERRRSRWFWRGRN